MEFSSKDVTEKMRKSKKMSTQTPIEKTHVTEDTDKGTIVELGNPESKEKEGKKCDLQKIQQRPENKKENEDNQNDNIGVLTTEIQRDSTERTNKEENGEQKTVRTQGGSLEDPTEESDMDWRKNGKQKALATYRRKGKNTSAHAMFYRMRRHALSLEKQ